MVQPPLRCSPSHEVSRAQELQKSLARHASVQRDATASATQLSALTLQHSSLLASLEAQDAELADELESSKAQLTAALVRPGL